jgi:hypothetical protein
VQGFLGCRVELGVFKGDKSSFQKFESKITPLIKNPKLIPSIGTKSIFEILKNQN